ncbi:MAG TPA: hypothetical protein ENJ62_06585 [Bryobacterales bacterium]|nr:hypothetical protein [Bryobacterales bacterium]
MNEDQRIRIAELAKDLFLGTIASVERSRRGALDRSGRIDHDEARAEFGRYYEAIMKLVAEPPSGDKPSGAMMMVT